MKNTVSSLFSSERRSDFLCLYNVYLHKDGLSSTHLSHLSPPNDKPLFTMFTRIGVSAAVLAYTASVSARSFTVKNNCDYTIWPGVSICLKIFMPVQSS